MRRLKNFGWIIFGMIVIGYVGYKIILNSFSENIPGDSAKRIEAVIIDERNYMPNQPVKAKFTYSYQFVVNGKVYIGDSHNEILKVGDSIEVEYKIEHPIINRPFNRKD